MIRILSLGAGVQSSALLLMSIRGELPRIDHAIFADTGWEPASVYEHLEWLKVEAVTVGIPIHTVTAGNLRADVLDRQARKDKGKRRASMPLFTLNPDGSDGMIRRQCTSVYKIEPIERFIIREILGIGKGKRRPVRPVVEHWLGITWDENQRMRISPEKWKVHAYPFCCEPAPLSARFIRSDGTPRRWTRAMCEWWLAENYPGRVIPRSACLGCPFHSDPEWQRIKEQPAEWADVVGFERRLWAVDGILDIHGKPFLHSKRIPLDQIDFRSTDQKNNQLPLMLGECEGMCGV
jgi:hypothetical protein